MRGPAPPPVSAVEGWKGRWVFGIDRGSGQYRPEWSPPGWQAPALCFCSLCSRMVSKIFRRSLPPFQCCKTESAHRPCQWRASLPDRVTQPVPSIGSLETRRAWRTKLPSHILTDQYFSAFHLPHHPQEFILGLELIARPKAGLSTVVSG